MKLVDEACIICNENFQENESKAGITKLPCKHFFDRDCIVPWLELVSEDDIPVHWPSWDSMTFSHTFSFSSLYS